MLVADVLGLELSVYALDSKAQTSLDSEKQQLPKLLDFHSSFQSSLKFIKLNGDGGSDEKIRKFNHCSGLIILLAGFKSR